MLATPSFAGDHKAVTISKPLQDSTVASPLEVCMSPWGAIIEADNDVNEEKRNNYILVDVDLPSDLNQPITKDSNHIAMDDDTSCTI